MKKKRFVALVLLFLVTVCTLAGCGGGKEPVATTVATTAAGTTAATTAATTSKKSTTSIPVTSATPQTTSPEELASAVKGHEFVIAGEKGDGDTWYVTTPNTALQNQQLQAYREIEDRLDIIITFDLSQNYDTVLANAVAGRATADFVCFRHQYWIPLAIKGYIQPLNTDAVRAAGLDVTDPEQVDIYHTSATMGLDGENVWAVAFSGRYYISPWGHGLVFNKKLCENAGYPAEDIYQMVRDHTWTWDKFEEICRAVSDPNTGIDGYSMLTNDTVEIASNVAINSRTADGRWTSNIDSEEFIRAAKWVNRILYDRDVCVEPSFEIGSGDHRHNFYAGIQGFMALWWGDFGYMDDKCNTTMHDDYGYVPFPMGPDATEYSHVFADLYGFCLETANGHPNESVFILSQLAEKLNDPAAYAVYARGFMRDDESVEMIMEYMLPNATFNTARLSSGTRQVIKEMVPQILAARSESAVVQVLETYAARMRQEIDLLFE